MSANVSDKITDTRNAGRPNSARVSSPRSSGGTSLSCDDLTGWPTASKVHFATYQIDSNSNPVAGTQLDCYGIVSGNTIGSLAVVDGTDSGNSVNDVVEMLPTAAWGQDLSDALTSTHNRSGGLKSGITLTLPTIADHTNATHTHATNAQGGQLGASGIATGTTLADKLQNQYKFRVSRNAAANTGNGAFAVIAFDTEQYDSNNNVAAGVFTVPVSGFYQFNWAMTVSNSGTAQLTVAALFKNGTEISDGTHQVTTNVTISSNGSDAIQCTAGDTVDVRAFCTGTQPLSVGNIYLNYFSGFLISAT